MSKNKLVHSFSLKIYVQILFSLFRETISFLSGTLPDAEVGGIFTIVTQESSEVLNCFSEQKIVNQMKISFKIQDKTIIYLLRYVNLFFSEIGII